MSRQWEEKKISKPIVFVIDGYKAHMSLRLFRWCRSNEVILVVLYPGATPFLQMCDTTMFKPMKEKHSQLYSQWRLKNPTKIMNDVEFVKLLKEINDQVIRKEMIINGWRATGLQPFDFNNLNVASLPAKSPDFIYNFKGDIVHRPEIEFTSIADSGDFSMDWDFELRAQDAVSNSESINTYFLEFYS